MLSVTFYLLFLCYVRLPLTDRPHVGLPVVGSVCLNSWHLSLFICHINVTGFTGPLVGFIECFMTTFLRAHSWLKWVDEDDDGDEVGLKEKPEDTRYIKKITSK